MSNSRVGNITVHFDDSDPVEVRPQAPSTDHVDERVCVFVEVGSVRLQFSGSADALRLVGQGIADAATVVEQRKIAARVPVGQF